MDKGIKYNYSGGHPLDLASQGSQPKPWLPSDNE